MEARSHTPFCPSWNFTAKSHICEIPFPQAWFGRTLVRSHASLSFDDADQILAAGGGWKPQQQQASTAPQQQQASAAPELLPHLQQLCAVAEALRRRFPPSLVS